MKNRPHTFSTTPSRNVYHVYDPFGTSRLPEDREAARKTRDSLTVMQEDVKHRVATKTAYNEWAINHPIQKLFGIRITRTTIYCIILIIQMVYMLINHGTLNPVPALMQLSSAAQNR